MAAGSEPAEGHEPLKVPSPTAAAVKEEGHLAPPNQLEHDYESVDINLAAKDPQMSEYELMESARHGEEVIHATNPSYINVPSTEESVGY